MTRAGARRCGLALALLGGALVGRALWIPAKAALAQALLERAWRETRATAGERSSRPWAWADTWPVARLRAPRLGISRIVLASATGRTLAFAPGHVDGTASPGTAGNSVLAGHRDTNFEFLRELRHGDELEVELADGGRARYRVRESLVVDRAHSRVLAPTDEEVLTLITCWPFDALAPGGRQRYVIRAHRVNQ